MYCVYITFYSGTKLPPLYIGSSSVNRVLNKNYHGTVTSKVFKDIWKQELKNNPDLFETAIISTHSSKEDAVKTELKEQIFFDVVKNPKFINRSLATINGCFTMDNSGEKNPMFNRNHTTESKLLMSKTRREQETQKGERNAMFGKFGSDHPSFGYRHTEEFKQRLQVPKPVVTCPHCGASGGKPAMTRFHFDKCKKITSSTMGLL